MLKNVELYFSPEFHPSMQRYLKGFLSSYAKNITSKVSLAEFEILHDDREFYVDFIIHPVKYNNLDFNCFVETDTVNNNLQRAGESGLHSFLTAGAEEM